MSVCFRCEPAQGVSGAEDFFAVLVLFAAVVRAVVDFAAVDFAAAPVLEAVLGFAVPDFAAVVFVVPDFEAAAFVVEDFAAVDVFFAVPVFAVVFRVVVFFLAGPFARFSASSSNARVGEMPSTESSLRRVALVVPSVTYGPKRPSLTTTGFLDSGSSPSSLSGAAAVCPRRCLGFE